MWSKAGSSVHHFSKWVLIISLITVALLSIGGRILLNNIEYFKTEIEQELADYGITGVALENIEGSWKNFHPLLKIRGASLSIPGRSQALSINELELSVKLIPSLIYADLKLESLHARVQKLILVHDRQGQWWLNDIPLTSVAGESKTSLDIYALFQRLPDFVNIDIQLTQVRDLLNDIDYLIQKSSLRSSRKQERLSLALLAHLPNVLGGKIELYLKGDALRQQVYASAKNLNLVRLLQLADKPANALKTARMSLQSWVELDNFEPRELRNVASLTQVLFNGEFQNEKALSAKLRQKLEQHTDSWRIHTRVDSLQKAGREFSGFESQLYLHKNNRSRPGLWVSALDLEELTTLFSNSIENSEFRQLIDALQAKASLRELIAELDLDQLQLSTFGVDIAQFQSRAHQAIPGVNSLNGRIISASGNSRLQVFPAPMTVKFTSLVRTPLEFDEFSGTLDITQQDNGLLLQADSIRLANQDVRLQARAWMEAQNGQTPFLSLRADYQDGQVSATSKYLPVSIMGDKTVAWLDKSIRDGHIPEGGLLFHGRLQKLARLEQEQSGEFHALFRVDDPEVSFLPDWPSAHKGSGQASFHNTSMNLSFSGVHFDAAIVDQVDLSIPNLLRAELLISGTTQSRSEDVLDTLEAMPILDFAEEINKRKQLVSGLVSTDLDLRIPLTSKIREKISIKASAELQDVGLVIPQWMVDFQQVNGKLQIDNKRITAKGLKGLYYDDSAILDISTDRSNERTRFNLNGELDSRKLARLLPDYLQQPVSGSSPWKIQVSLANRPSKKNVPVRIHAASTLAGTQFDFPQPFAVAREQQPNFLFDATISARNLFDFNASLNDKVHVKGMLDLEDQSDGALTRLQVNLGLDNPVPVKSGYHLSGELDALNKNDWDVYLAKYFREGFDAPSLYQRIQSVDLSVGNLIWGSQQANENKITLLNNGFFLNGKIDSSLLKGTFRVPYSVNNQNPVTADLEFIRLQKHDQIDQAEPQIDEMPNLLINSKRVSYEDMEFTGLVLETRTDENKFEIRKLEFSRDDVNLTSSGHWQHNTQTNEHVTVFNISINGNQFGQVVSSLGLGDTIRNGRIKFDGQIGWAGSLFNINWPSLIGEVELSLKDGYLVNVDPGAGRLVGLMSLNALYKRLYLDFADVLSEGMQFDEIKGVFSIKGEVMTTSNASMDAASARVNVSGTTNLRDKTYDQSMIIIPKVGDTLPVLGSLAAGPTVGWGLLLLQKIFKKPIDKSVEIEYKVTGSWEEPTITLISKPQPDVLDEHEIFDETS